ncbi:cytochrome P450 monooxygenase [Penicillium verhagenii]|nr:cytochrome P450 monooxygenase [Penicillium verhagenii]
MAIKHLYLQGDDVSTAKPVALDGPLDLNGVQSCVAAHFAIFEPKVIGFQDEKGAITTIPDLISADGPIAITINGRPVHDVPGPVGLPYIGNYWEVYPDHLGNHQRLFDTFGPIFKTSSFGRTLYHTNNPEIASIIFAESDFFTKEINRAHPLYGVRDKDAGIFLSDTDTPAWRSAHKFFPLLWGQRQWGIMVQPYSKLQKNLSGCSMSWKGIRKIVARLTLGMDLKHFSSIDANLHELVILFAEILELNKKVATQGDWYAMLPFGDNRKLQQRQDRLKNVVVEAIKQACTDGAEDLALQDAALKAENMADYAARATDKKGHKLSGDTVVQGLTAITAAGLSASSALLSWLIYSLVTYPGMQDRLLQELIDNGISANTPITPHLTSQLSFLDKFIKETQRRHTPSYNPARTVKVDLILPTGHRLSKGSVVIGALYHIHNNPKLWDNPTRFDPDRWDTDEVKKRSKTSYIPFATGPRRCIGFNFALQEVKIIICKLVYRYRFSREGYDTVQYDPLAALIIPTNLYVRTARRLTWPSQGGVGGSV